MNTRSSKQDAIDVIEHLPDDVTLDEIVYRLHLLNKVRQGLRDIDSGKTASSEEVAREIQAW